MIRSRDVNKEVKKLDALVVDEKANDSAVLKGILKAVTLVVKLVRDVRTNQVLALEAQKIDLIKEDKNETEKK